LSVEVSIPCASPGSVSVLFARLERSRRCRYSFTHVTKLNDMKCARCTHNQPYKHAATTGRMKQRETVLIKLQKETNAVI
jgi:hypothetical protein